jgi:hypothetical protein
MECDNPECPQCGGSEASFCCDVYRFHLGACGRCELVWLEGSDPIFPWRGEDEDDWRLRGGASRNTGRSTPRGRARPGRRSRSSWRSSRSSRGGGSEARPCPKRREEEKKDDGANEHERSRGRVRRGAGAPRQVGVTALTGQTRNTVLDLFLVCSCEA